MGLNKVPFTLHHLLGVFVIVGGILVFHLGGKDAGGKAARSAREANNQS